MPFKLRNILTRIIQVCAKKGNYCKYVYNIWMLRENPNNRELLFNIYNLNMIRYLWQLFKYFVGKKNRTALIPYEYSLVKNVCK